MNEQNGPSLPAYTGTNKTDTAVAIGKGVVGIVPLVGPLIAEVVSVLIPNQRIDRIARLIEKLEKKVAGLEQQRVQEEFSRPEFIDLLEDGFVHASRALSDERLEYLTSLLKNSLSEEQLSYIESKRLLALLSELNDMEVIILASCHWDNTHNANPPFWERHKQVLRPRAADLGSSAREIDEAAVYSSYRQHIVSLGLLEPRFRTPRRGELPEFDGQTGLMKATGYEITRLGELLLRQIDLVHTEEAT
jgi:hypothetical protein